MPESPRKEPSLTSGLGAVMGFSAQMVTSTLVGGALGFLTDRWLETGPYLLVLGILLGGAGGIVTVWRSWNRLNQ